VNREDPPVNEREPILRELPEDDGAVLPCTSLASYFRSAVGKARQNQGLEATDTAEYYVVNVLESFADADQLFGVDEDGNRVDEAMAITLCKALDSHYHEKINHFRQLGDRSLFISGFFADSLRRRSVGVTYYIDMGQGAYSSLAGLMRNRGGAVFKDLYSELAGRFSQWVEVLREVSEETKLSAAPQDQPRGTSTSVGPTPAAAARSASPRNSSVAASCPASDPASPPRTRTSAADAQIHLQGTSPERAGEERRKGGETSRPESLRCRR
jgi:hypothetical protein